MLFQSLAMRELEIPLDLNQPHRHYRHHRSQGNSLPITAGIATFASLHLFFSSETRRIGSRLHRRRSALCRSGNVSEMGMDHSAAHRLSCRFGGCWLTGRAMKPVHDLVRSTRDISERICPDASPSPMSLTASTAPPTRVSLMLRKQAWACRSLGGLLPRVAAR